jgi:ADP-ribose pyrophosphatase YjhB (NUDIX family)
MVRLSSAIVTNRGRILLFLRDARPVRDPNRWSLIGGHVEDDETFEQALVREVAEEIGVRPKRFRYLADRSGVYGEDIALFHVPLTDEEATRTQLGDEGQEIAFFTAEQLDGLPLTANLELLLVERRDMILDAISGISHHAAPIE